MITLSMAQIQALQRIHKFFTDSDMAAAEQLMQLSDEENNNSSNDNNNNGTIDNKRKNKSKNFTDYEFDRRSQLDEITSKKIEEIFGKEEEIHRPRKKRYRSLESIYESTTPMNNVRHGRKG